jgi:S-adenosylmethionine:tRNA ribosyltransferase-isomerase
MREEERYASAYDYDLPPHLIAQKPAPERDASRLMVISDGKIEHHIFRELPEILHPGDLLIFNETRVIAARLFGYRESNDNSDSSDPDPSRKVEILLLRPSTNDRYDPNATRWLALAKPGRKLPVGSRVAFLRPSTPGLRPYAEDDRMGYLAEATVVAVHDDGIRDLEFTLHVPFETLLERAGTLPLPPYIHNDTREAQERYQTVFAREPGSVAAPTAALHFTNRLLERISARGIETAKLTLDVGLGTFRPMKTERLDQHTMHSETYTLPAETVAAIERAKAEGRRVIAVGTTVVRALESNARSTEGTLTPGEGIADCFITPGFEFKIVDAMVTNFHLPRSTLLVLVSAFAGREQILHAYGEAVAQNYRFFSFGDAMLIEGVRRSGPV